MLWHLDKLLEHRAAVGAGNLAHVAVGGLMLRQFDPLHGLPTLVRACNLQEAQ